MVRIASVVRSGLTSEGPPGGFELGARMGDAVKAARRGEERVEIVLIPDAAEPEEPFSCFVRWGDLRPKEAAMAPVALVIDLSACWKRLRA
jgi:hypothetical protein